jgi:hypothetical protein
MTSEIRSIFLSNLCWDSEVSKYTWQAERNGEAHIPRSISADVLSSMRRLRQHFIREEVFVACYSEINQNECPPQVFDGVNKLSLTR